MNPNYQVIISAKDQTKQAFDSIIGNLGKVNGLVAGIGLSVSVGGFATLVKQAADFNDEMVDMAQTLGTTTEGLSALQYAAKFGGGVDELNAGLAKLAKNANDAANGSKSAQQAFDQIGIDPSKFADTSELFTAIAEQLSKLPDGIQKTALAQELFGKSGAKLLPLINEGKQGIEAFRKEAEALGLVVNQQDAKASQQFNDNLDRLGLTAKGLAVQFGNEFIPALDEIATRMLNASKEGGVLLGVLTGIGALGEVMIFGTEQEQRAERISELSRQIAYQSKELNNASSQSNPAVLQGLREKIALAKKEMQELVKLQSEPFNKKTETPAGASGTGGGVGTKTDAERKAEAAARAATSFVDSLKKQADQLGKTKIEQLEYEASLLSLTDSEKKLANTYLEKIKIFEKNVEAQKLSDEMSKASFDAEVQRQKDLIDWDKEEIKSQQAWVDAADSLNQKLIEQNEQLSIDLIADDTKRAEARLALENKRMVETIESMKVEQEVIDGLLEKQSTAYKQQLEKLGQESKKTGGLGKDLGLQFKSSFEDAVVGGKKFGDVLDSLGQDIERLAMRRLVLEPLLGAFDNLLGGFDISSFIPSITANAKGGVYSGAGISAYSGQVVSSPTVFPFAKGIGLMGEAGPEAIVPLKRTANGALGVSAEGVGGGVTVNVYEAPGTKATVQQEQGSDGRMSINLIVEQLYGVMNRDIARGTGIAPVMERRYGLNRVAGGM